MKVLLNDGMDEEGIKLFRNAGIESDKRKRDPKALVEQIGEFDALVVSSATVVTREIIESGGKGNLKVIGRAGVGTDNIDIKCRGGKRCYRQVRAVWEHQRHGGTGAWVDAECFEKGGAGIPLFEEGRLAKEVF